MENEIKRLFRAGNKEQRIWKDEANCIRNEDTLFLRLLEVYLISYQDKSIHNVGNIIVPLQESFSFDIESKKDEDTELYDQRQTIVRR